MLDRYDGFAHDKPADSPDSPEKDIEEDETTEAAANVSRHSKDTSLTICRTCYM